jgi:menaquinone-dependent protoporphyrinogen IX oxidase
MKFLRQVEWHNRDNHREDELILMSSRICENLSPTFFFSPSISFSAGATDREDAKRDDESYVSVRLTNATKQLPHSASIFAGAL